MRLVNHYTLQLHYTIYYRITTDYQLQFVTVPYLPIINQRNINICKLLLLSYFYESP